MINQFNNVDVQQAILANQWVYGQLFPEIVSPGQMPLDFKYKTHTFSSRFSDTVNVWNSASYDPTTNAIVQHAERKGKLWVYFAPTNDLLSLSSVLGVDLDILNNNSIFYSSSNGPLPYSAFTVFDHREITLNASSKKNISLAGYKKLRVTSAAICIKQIGPEKERSGILKIGMSYKGAIENVPAINFDKFQNYFNISEIIPLADSNEIICRYRLPQHLLETYAPFDPTTNVPYFFIYGEGISSKMSFEIEVIRHFEGMILPEYSNFHNPIAQPKQTPFEIQNEVIRIIEKERNIIQNMETNDTGNTPGFEEEKMQHYREHVHSPLEPLKTDTNLSAYENVMSKVGQKITEVGDKFNLKAKESLGKQGKKVIIKVISKAVPDNAKLRGIVETVNRVYDMNATFTDNVANVIGNIADKVSDYSLKKAEVAFDRLLNKFA